MSEGEDAVVDGDDAIKHFQSSSFSLSPSGIVQVLATLTEAPDSAIWRSTGVEAAAGEVAAAAILVRATARER